MNLRWVHIAAFALVMLCWLVFAGLFLLQKKAPREKATRLERRSVIGIVVQGVAYAAVWMLERPRFTPDLLRDAREARGHRPGDQPLDRSSQRSRDFRDRDRDPREERREAVALAVRARIRRLRAPGA